jgi:hypothetical protein
MTQVLVHLTTYATGVKQDVHVWRTPRTDKATNKPYVLYDGGVWFLTEQTGRFTHRAEYRCQRKELSS